MTEPDELAVDDDDDVDEAVRLEDLEDDNVAFGERDTVADRVTLNVRENIGDTDEAVVLELVLVIIADVEALLLLEPELVGMTVFVEKFEGDHDIVGHAEYVCDGFMLDHDEVDEGRCVSVIHAESVLKDVYVGVTEAVKGGEPDVLFVIKIDRDIEMVVILEYDAIIEEVAAADEEEILEGEEIGEAVEESTEDTVNDGL